MAIFGAGVGGQPRPRPPWERVASRTSPPRGVNFTALERRFQSTCWMRPSSAMMVPTPSSMRLSSKTPFACAAVRTVSNARSLHGEHRGRGLVEELDGPACVALGEGVARPSRSLREAVELRHLEVEENERKVLVCGDLHRLDAGARTDQALAERLEDGLERHQVRRMIVDQQDVRRRDRSDRASMATRSRCGRRPGFVGGFAPRMPVRVSFALAAAGSTRASPHRWGHRIGIFRAVSSSERSTIARRRGGCGSLLAACVGTFDEPSPP